MIHFDLPKDKSSIIKVIGVGGGGSNAVNHMHDQGIEGVNFIICNTDAQAIAQSKVPNKVQLGPHLTQGLGAGANPNIGKEATEESLEEIKAILEVNTKMVFVTAGMGGGTGTGGAPIVAKISKEMGILTVGIVTTPFGYEGKRRMQQAEEGINRLKDQVDTLLVINNDKLRQQFGNLKMSEAFAKADNILATAAKCITDVINVTGQINVDFADVCTVMKNGGVAILGNAAVAGENRAQQAIEEALNSPLLNDNDIRGARWILLNINSAEGEYEHTMDEVEIISQYIEDNAGQGVDVIMGQGYDNTLGDKLSITLIATGFEQKSPFAKYNEVKQEPKPEKIVMVLGSEEQAKPTVEEPQNTVINETNMQLPTALVPTLVEQQVAQPTIQLFTPTANTAPAATIVTEPVPQRVELNLAQPVTDYQAQQTNSFLAKPTNIYDANAATQMPEVKQPENVAKENTIIWDMEKISEAELPPMELVIREEAPAMQETVISPAAPMETPIETPIVPVQPIQSNWNGMPMEENDELTKAAERTKKLRNLSFNYNGLDADELENTPAYLRRKDDIHNTLASVEKFYSDYTVNVNENNEAIINTNSKNSFLEGERPD
jgi:cell division protein FtsZ